MRYVRLISLVFVTMLLFSAPLLSKFGVIKTNVKFALYHPPAFHTQGRQIRLEVDSVDMRRGFMMVPRIQHFLENGLERQNFKLSPDARTVLQCTLTDATASLERVSRTESVNVHMGEHTEKKKDGKTKQVEDCKNQTVPVIFLVSSGHLALEVKATDTQTQALLMSRVVERSYRQESEVGGPPKCHGEAYVVAQNQWQDSDSILQQLGDEVTADTLSLAAGYDEPREVLLAVDDELKPGNAQAQAGDWQSAMDAWKNASTPGPAVEAARQYNLGVATEAMAAAAMHNWQLDDASSNLSQAREYYAQARKLDPNEKYFRDAEGRLKVDAQLLQQQEEQSSEGGSGNPGAAPNMPAPGAPPLPPVQLESWPAGEPGAVHDYRVYVRTRLSAQPGQLPDSLREELLAGAGDYGVQQDVALQVLDSETQQLTLLRQNMAKYREDFQAADVGGVITSEARQMLRKRQQILHLSDEQVKEIESQFKFKESDN